MYIYIPTPPTFVQIYIHSLIDYTLGPIPIRSLTLFECHCGKILPSIGLHQKIYSRVPSTWIMAQLAIHGIPPPPKY